MTFLLPLVASWVVGAVFLALDGRRRWVTTCAAGVAAAVAAMDVVLLVQFTIAGGDAFTVTTGGWPAGVGIRLRVGGAGLFFGTICALVLAVVLAHEARAEVRSRLFPSLVLLLSAGLHGAFFTGDLFNFYVFFELSVITSFALAAYGYGRAEVRGTFIYVALNVLGSVLFLIGVAAVYLSAGTLDFAALESRLGSDQPALMLPAALLFVALSIKLGLFPFHAWVPVLYSHARPAVVAALTGALTNVGAYGLLRLGQSVLDQARREAASVLVAVGAIAAVYGALLALRRRNPAEIGGYAAVAHAGYLVFAVGVGGQAGVLAVLLAVLAGSVDKPSLFLSLDGGRRARQIAGTIAGISVAGLPVTAGFLFKVQLVRAALVGPLAIAATAALVASSALLLAAVVRFWRLQRDAPEPRRPRGAAALVLAAVAVVAGLAPQPLIDLALVSAAEILESVG